ncbi:hypothetical protein F2Q69_00017437 [Brassica cretica]|uniref:Uncharacterized protein n=1 Tax=Brassica cretica TaxID=69181 RepID=A0A8S9QRZ8_BRACR|nr:hypothetical protein F2Q69_00017437 [Brassica cretica]
MTVTAASSGDFAGDASGVYRRGVVDYPTGCARRGNFSKRCSGKAEEKQRSDAKRRKST